MQLSVNLVGVLSQTLVKRKDGRGRVAAFESLVATSAVRNLIRENKTYQIGSMIQTGARAKMQTLDQSLAILVDKGIVENDEARSRAKDYNEYDRLVALSKSGKPVSHAHAPANPDDKDGAPTPAKGVRGQPNRPSFKRE